MTELQNKINVIEHYLFIKGKRTKSGKRIRIVFKNQDNTLELQKLDSAFNTANNFFLQNPHLI
jgi:hypothetical protein